jgi:hypothetical protein
MKTHRTGFVQKLPRISRPAYRHNPLFINSLVAFNFRPPIRLKFPGERLARTTGFSR